MAENPFFAPSSLPYQLPPFDGDPRGALPARVRARAWPSSWPRWRRSRRPQDPPTFDNTVAALERSGRILERVATVFFSIASSDATDGLREIEKRDLARADQAQRRHPARTARSAPGSSRSTDGRPRGGVAAGEIPRGLRPGRRRPVGGRPGAARELNQELSTAVHRPSRRTCSRASTGSRRWSSTDAKELDGLSDEPRSRRCEKDGALRAAAAQLHQPAGPRPAHRPRGAPQALRAVASSGRRENFELAIRMATPARRAGRAAGLPQPRRLRRRRPDGQDHGGGRGDARPAGRPGRAPTPAEEAEALAEQAGFPIEPWDWSVLRREGAPGPLRLRRRRRMRPYFELNRVLQRRRVLRRRPSSTAITFTERHDLAGYHPDVRVFEVFDADGIAARPVPARPLRPPDQARRRVDEQPRRPVAPVRRAARGDEQPQHHQARRGSRRC